MTDLEREWATYLPVLECLGMEEDHQAAAMREAFYAGMCRMFFILKGMDRRPITEAAKEQVRAIWETELRAIVDACANRPCPVHGHQHRRRDVP